MSWASVVWPSERARLMSAHMQPIERLAAEATVEIVGLESWLDDELRCEMNHEAVPCSEEVTHRLRGCRRPLNMCRNAAEYKTQQAQIRVCSHCGEPAVECWKIRPI